MVREEGGGFLLKDKSNFGYIKASPEKLQNLKNGVNGSTAFYIMPI